MAKFKAKYDLEAGYDTEPWEVKKGTILYSRKEDENDEDSLEIVYFNDKAICDIDSPMCENDLELIE